ncbi:MAG: M24 family metallopeptidase, partial [Gaiellaceae bacterium]
PDWPAITATNVAKVKREMAARGIALLAVNNVDNVRYLTGYSPVSGPFMVHANWAVLAVGADRPILFGFNFYVDSIRNAFPWNPDVRAVPASMATAIAEIAADEGAAKGRLGFDGYLSYAVGKELEGALPDAELVSGDDALYAARTIKEPAEIEIIRRAVAVGEMGMRAGIDACVEGAMEFEASAAADNAMRSFGAEAVPYSSIVTAGENAAIMQELSTDKIMRNGEIVMLDLGCMYEGYHSDFARSVLVGAGSATADQKAAYRANKAALDAMLAEMKPGASCGRIESVAREAITEAGFGDYAYTYFPGHGIGMSPWEPPIIDVGASAELQAGMVIDIEPGIHKPGVAGMRLEETVLISETGCEVLTKTEFCEELLN